MSCREIIESGRLHGSRRKGGEIVKGLAADERRSVFYSHLGQWLETRREPCLELRSQQVVNNIHSAD